MTDELQTSDVSKSLAALVKADSICGRFEAAWQKNERPDLQIYLNESSESERGELLGYLLKLQIYYLRQRGETIDVDEYHRKFPSYSSLIKSALNGSSNGQSHTLVERPVHTECPDCHVEVALENSFILQATCQKCGSTFDVPKREPSEQRSDTPESIGRFEVREYLGGGTFGRVYRAYDPDLHCEVAIKIPRYDQFANREEERRFLREARATFELNHPHIVRAHSVGHERKTPYIVSDFIDGGSLDSLMERRELSAQEAAQIAAQIADALHYAHDHEKNIIHRDVKPGNILIDDSGKSYLSDFGLARREEEEEGPDTLPGQVLGTLLYMSPEQARGEIVDGRSDVYSLGVVLFQMLTGKVPFKGNRQEVMHALQFQEPPRPKSINADIPDDLQTICLKCLHKDPTRRFETAAEMAAELRLFREGRRISTRPVGILGRWWEWVARNPIVASLSVALVASLVIAGVLTYFGQVERRMLDQLTDIESKVAEADIRVWPPPLPKLPGQGVEVQTLDEMYADNSEYLVEDALQSRFPRVRRRAAMVLGRFGSSAQDATGQLQETANSDKSDEVRREAEKALKKIEEAPGGPPDSFSVDLSHQPSLSRLRTEKGGM